MLRLPPKQPKKKRRQGDQVRCPAHLRFVREHRCSVPGCDLGPIEAAHVRTGGDGGLGVKPGDNRTISLCRFHHVEQHGRGEISFAEKYRIDLAELAATFWQQSPARVAWERKERAA